jgi:DNA-binding transcriptional MocR family regulator
MVHKEGTDGTAKAIAQSLEIAILGHRLAPGEALVPVRVHAAELGVSPATVAAAYRRLRDRGLVVAAGRRGTRVAPAAPVPARPATQPLDPDIVDLATGGPDPDLLPPLSAALAGLRDLEGGYGDAPVVRELVAFARAELEADGVSTEDAVVVGGGLDGLERILREETRVGDAVAVEDPGFPGLLDLLAAGGLRPAPFVVDDEGPVPDALAASLAVARVAIVTPRAQNPTGAALTPERAARLKRVLDSRPDVLLVEDDYAGPVSGAPLVTLCDPARARWASVRSVTKWLGADLRLAVLAGDPLTVGRVAGRQALGARWVSRILQRAALAVWSDPSSGRRLARAADVYAQRRLTLIRALAGRGVAARGRSGFHVWVQVADEAAVVAALADRGWAVAPGRRFRLQSPPAVRITVATLTLPEARQLAADIAEALDAPARVMA